MPDAPPAEPSVPQAVIVVGTGPAGLATALALAAQGVPVTLVGPDPLDSADNRTAALFAGSIDLLVNLGVWEACRPASAPIAAIRLVDDTGRLLRAPEVVFHAREAGRDVLGHNVPNAPLCRALLAAVRAVPSIRTEIGRSVAQVTAEADRALVRLDDGRTLAAALVAGADGRGSVCRAGAGIATRAWGYPQAAITTSFAHARAHDGISSELHRPAGPLTTVPMPGRRSSLVWVETPAEARRLAALGDAGFRAELETHLAGLLGAIGEVAPLAVHPLSGLAAERMAARRVALVGEAGHVFPPIGAQGLNLGLRDAAVLAETVAGASAAGRDIGAANTLAAYDRARRPDVLTRTAAVDLLDRSLISGLLPMQIARSLGVHVIKALPPLKRLLVREGLTPSLADPALMRAGGGGLATLPAIAPPVDAAAA